MTLPLQQDLPGREQAQELARHELSRRQYAEAQPPWPMRLLRYLLDRFGELVDRAFTAVPGGGVGLAVLTVLVLGVIALVVWRIRPSGARRGSVEELFGDLVLTADGHRSRAEQAAAAGEFAEAVRERLRAVVRELEARGVLDPRPGRTVDEVAREAGAAVPLLAVPLLQGATVFDEVWYGSRVADAAAYQLMVGVDRTVTGARLARV